MEYFTVIHSLLTGLALVLALFALRNTNKTTPRRLTMRLAEQEAAIDRLTEWYKKLNANYALIVARSKRHTESDAAEDESQAQAAFVADDTAMRPGESASEWKKRMRQGIVAGRIGHR